MISIDTDILINFLTGKDVKNIEKIFRHIESKKMKIFLPLEVILEMAVLLEVDYKWEREDIYKVIFTFINDPLFKTDEKENLINALNIYKNSSLSFFDVLKIMPSDVDSIISYNKDFEKAGIKIINPSEQAKRKKKRKRAT